MVSSKHSPVLCARAAYGCHSNMIRSVLQETFQLHVGDLWASHGFLVELSPSKHMIVQEGASGLPSTGILWIQCEL